MLGIHLLTLITLIELKSVAPLGFVRPLSKIPFYPNTQCDNLTKSVVKLQVGDAIGYRGEKTLHEIARHLDRWIGWDVLGLGFREG